MQALIYPGTKEAAKMRDELQKRVALLPVRPKLAVIMVGHDARSEVYIGQKQKAGRSIGIEVEIVRPDSTHQSVMELIQKLNNDSQVHGIIVQLPVPKGIDKEAALASVAPQKDVDGLSPANLGRLMLGLPCHIPATVKAVMTVLEYAKCPLEGARVGVVGHGVLVGRPISALLPQKGATVTICTLETKNLGDVLHNQDIIIAAAGKAHLITADMVKTGVIVVDVGISSDAQGNLVGDVHPDVAQKAAFLTPPIGGIGPVNVACILSNTVAACEAVCQEQASA